MPSCVHIHTCIYLYPQPNHHAALSSLLHFTLFALTHSSLPICLVFTSLVLCTCAWVDKFSCLIWFCCRLSFDWLSAGTMWWQQQQQRYRHGWRFCFASIFFFFSICYSASSYSSPNTRLVPGPLFWFFFSFSTVGDGVDFVQSWRFYDSTDRQTNREWKGTFSDSLIQASTESITTQSNIIKRMRQVELSWVKLNWNEWNCQANRVHRVWYNKS